MFVDARELAPNHELSVDLCIIGSGPAGISLAREFCGTAMTVAVLESGGVEYEREAQALSVPAKLNLGNVKEIMCHRQVGGNASVWTVQTGPTWLGIRLMPLPPADFMQREHVANSGWPIDRAELDPYYARAQAVFRIGPYAYEGAEWASEEQPILPLPAERIKTRMYQFGDGNLFLGEYRRQLETSPNITVYYHATAVELETSVNGGAISAVRVKSAPERELRVRAGQVVLAGGGFATTQLLLNSDDVHQGGIGNAGGNLGHYLMDHPYVYGGELVPTTKAIFDHTTLYDMRPVDGVPMMAHLQIAEEALEREPLLGLSMLIFPRERNHTAHRGLSARQERGFDAFVKLRRDLIMGQVPRVELLGELACGADGIVKRAIDRLVYPKALIGRGGWSRLPLKSLRFHSYEVVQQVEQAPHYDNRVVLSSERDTLGMRRIEIDWRWHDEDMAATMRGQDLFAAELKRAGIGEFQIVRENGKPKVLSHSMAHYMGATRMHVSPSKGVVDANCQIHGLANLYVASCSVFPTGGFANPTLTIVALALRIGDRIKAQTKEEQAHGLRLVAAHEHQSTASTPAAT